MLRCRVWGGGGEWREGRSRRFAVELGTGMYGMGGRGRRFAVPLEYGGASRRFAVSAEYGIPRGASLSRLQTWKCKEECTSIPLCFISVAGIRRPHA